MDAITINVTLNTTPVTVQVVTNPTTVTINHQAARDAYQLALLAGYVGTRAEWLESLNGDDGREIEVQNNGTFVQWRYAGDSAWTNLIALADISGNDSTVPGPPGDPVEIQAAGGYIQWKYSSEDGTAWRNLVTIASITGPPGNDATVNATNVTAVLEAATPETALAEADKISFIKAVGSVLSSITWANLKAALQSAFTMLQFGGASAAFPALKRSGATLALRLADDTGDASFSAFEITASGPSSRMPNQVALYNDSVITRQLIRDEVFRMLFWSRLEARRLSYASAFNTGTGSSAAGNAHGPAAATGGTAINAKAMAQFESGMGYQSGTGGSWVIPEKFAFAGNAYSLLQHYTVSVTGIASGSNQFTCTSPSLSAQFVGARIWSPYFPTDTYITSVAGTVYTVSQNATGTMATASNLVFCMPCVSRFFACTAPIGVTDLKQRFCYETPQCDWVSTTTAGWNAGQSSLELNPNFFQSCTWTSGATSVTMAATNANIVAGMLVSGAGIQTGTTVVSVVGTTVNLSLATTAGGTSYNLGFTSPLIIGMGVSLDGIDPTVTVTNLVNNRPSDNLIAVVLSAPLPQNYASGIEIGFRNLDTTYYRNNNGIGFEWRPDPATGYVSLRIVIVKAGVVYYSPFAAFPEGIRTTWQPYWQWVLDYDSATNTARLFASLQTTSIAITTVQTTPIATLTVSGGIHGRAAGLQVALQSCNSNRYAIVNSTMNNIGTLGIDYFPNRKYPY